MTLAEYLAQPGVTASALAGKCKVATSTITRAAATGNASAQLMREIYEHTDGKVSPNGVVGIIPPPARKPTRKSQTVTQQ